MINPAEQQSPEGVVRVFVSHEELQPFFDCLNWDFLFFFHRSILFVVNKPLFRLEDAASVVGADWSETVQLRLVERRTHLSLRDLDVGDVEFGVGELCAGDDEPPVSVRRDGAFRIAFGKKAVFAVLDMVAVAGSERACERFTLFGQIKSHNV